MNHLQEIFMAYDRYTRDDDWSRNSRNDEGRWRDRDDRGQGGYGAQGYGSRGYGSGSQQRDDRDGSDYYGGRSSYGSSYGADRERSLGSRDFDYADRGSRGYGARSDRYGSDRQRFGDQGERESRYGNDRFRGDRSQQRDRLDYDSADRGFLARAGDEVRSWFGDEEAERRRERDQRYDEQMARYDDRHSDHAYRSWRDTQVSAFDRDYDEYRQENSQRFQSEFNAFRTERQTQRDSLTRVSEHMEVVGSDDEHVGTVDKVRGDRIILTKSDPDAGGNHHSIPSRWVSSVDGKVKLRKTAAEAKQAWRDEEQQQAMFGNQSQQRYGSDRFGTQGDNDDRAREANRYGASTTTGQSLGAGTSTTAGTGVSGSTNDTDTNLNRSFPGTY
ncbi:DUF2171 domain-containing protein [uncultured Sphingomonas sp.]|uniref:DUF2171 domain-containing protein n=1 Tax=uncultured Sphingomonas sp. TaxID=158754 RepID=UPI0025E6E939|nr:DUF2171 domain-containing protein [uncultured Sphingomonas sp.]